MAGASFCLQSALADLCEYVKEGQQDLNNADERARAHVRDVLSKITASAKSAEVKFIVPKTPGRKQTKARISTRRPSTQTASKRQTRSSAKSSKKWSSAKKEIATVQDEDKTSSSSEDPEKENSDVDLKSATRATRAASKKGPPAIKVEATTPLAKQSPRQPLRSTRQTRAQAKALVASSVSATPPRSAYTPRALLLSPANRVATQSKQLFSPYAKCSVQEKARAFESKEPISPMRSAAPPKSNKAAKNRTTAVAVTREGPSTPLPMTPVHSASELVAEHKAPVTRASLKTPVPPSPPKSDLKDSSEEEMSAIACVDVAPTLVGVTTSASPSKCNGEPSSLRSSPPISESEDNIKSTAMSPMASPDEKTPTPSTAETRTVKERRVTRASATASSLPAPSKATVPATAADVQAAGRPYSASSTSTAELDSDDEEWVESPATPKRPRLLPQSTNFESAGKKLRGAVGPTKTLRKDCPGHKASIGRKNLATPTSSFRSAPITPRQITPSKSTLKTSIFEEPTRSRHDSSSNSELEQQRKQELLRMKTEATKKEREQRLAKVQAQRERREAERREQEKLRQREAQQKELERLKQRTAFHQRKQSERSLNVDGLAAATKRKAESPLASASKRPTPLKVSKPPKMARNACADAEAARLIFGQPSTSLSQKAKLNNSLQQKALLNSLTQSLRDQTSVLPSPEEPQAASSSQSITQLVESTPEKKPHAALNVTVTLSSEDKPAEALGETFIMPSTDHDNSTGSKTPAAANSTFVRTDGPPRSSGYDITPHRSELPPEPIKDKDNYDIADLNSGDETDDDEKPRKEVPAWAKGAALNALITRQSKGAISGLEFFGVMPVPSLDKIFQVKKKTFNKRTSSALWD